VGSGWKRLRNVSSIGVVALSEMAGRVLGALALAFICGSLTGCEQKVDDQSTSTTSRLSSPSGVPSASAPASTSPVPPNAASYSTALDAGIGGIEAKTGLTYFGGTCTSAQSCLGAARVFGDTGAGAAYVRIAYSAPSHQQLCGQTSCGDCFAYVFFESGGWHYTQPVVCPTSGGTNSGSNPVNGELDHVFTSGGCVNVRSYPGLNSRVVDCLKGGQVVMIDQDSPWYVDKHIWWSIDGHRGWMAHDFLITL